MNINEDMLRVAIGNALMKLNVEVLNNRNEKEKLLMNKVALRLIDFLLKELGININGKKENI